MFLPRHTVIHEDKETTKMRIVFDASSKRGNGNSLNDELSIRLPLREDIINIMIRRRTHKNCFAVDIMKMYHTQDIMISNTTHLFNKPQYVLQLVFLIFMIICRNNL